MPKRSNAAIFYASDAFQTSGATLMGRQSAGESFLRGFIRHGDVERFYFWNWSGEAPAAAQDLVAAIEPSDKPTVWLRRDELYRVAEPGCLFVSAPSLAPEAWNRRVLGAARYSLCGLTHTTASAGAMDAISDFLTAPVEPWDALICTSRAVRDSVEVQHGLVADFLRERLGPIEVPSLRLETIPLGVNTSDFTRSEQDRASWRQQLSIPDDGIAVLFVGRFSVSAKMNPGPMALALERAARRTQKPVHWILVGWAGTEPLRDMYAKLARDFAPSVTVHVLDGREPKTRFPIWSAGDVFFSLSDNIQETFGLTPIEAMAAGLPSVVSDWNGYRDTVRDRIDGFRIPTTFARPQTGGDLAYSHANGWRTYDHYTGAASQFAAVDIDAAAGALLSLFESADLRRTMGEAARSRAREVFDWKAVIPQYQALWGDLEQIRLAAAPKPPGGLNPRRPDPFTLFKGYPTRSVTPATRISLDAGALAHDAVAMLDNPSVAYTRAFLPLPGEIEAVLAALATQPTLTLAALLAPFAPARRGFVERGVLWLAKFGFVRLDFEAPGA